MQSKAFDLLNGNTLYRLVPISETEVQLECVTSGNRFSPGQSVGRSIGCGAPNGTAKDQVTWLLRESRLRHLTPEQMNVVHVFIGTPSEEWSKWDSGKSARLEDPVEPAKQRRL